MKIISKNFFLKYLGVVCGWLDVHLHHLLCAVDYKLPNPNLFYINDLWLLVKRNKVLLFYPWFWTNMDC